MVSSAGAFTLVKFMMTQVKPAMLFKEVMDGKGQPLLINYLGAGGNPNIIHDSTTLLHAAVSANNVDAVKILLWTNAIDVNAVASKPYERTALMKACERVDRKEIASLLIKDPRVDVRHRKGSPSPFHLLVTGFQKDLVFLWLDEKRPLSREDATRIIIDLGHTRFHEEWPYAKTLEASRDAIAERLRVYLRDEASK